MSAVTQDLHGLSENNQSQPNGAESPQGDISQVVQDAMQQAMHEKEQQQKEAAYQKRLAQQKAYQQREQQAIQEATAPVVEALKKEMSEDKSFQHLVEDNAEFPESLIQYCAETGEPEEAPGIIRELANNEDYRRQLDRADTEVKMRRLINKIRKDILTGGSQGKIPQMLQKNIPQFNPNNSNNVSADNSFYKDVARRHGI